MPRPSRPPLPPLSSVIGDLWTDRTAFGTLVAGVAALFAAGLDPRLLGPTLSTVQEAVRAQPSLEGLLFVVGLLTAIMLLIGGAIGDLSRARPLIRGSLIVLVGAALFGLLVPNQELLLPSRTVAVIAASLLFPVSLASVALAYNGIARATAIGIAYGAYGGGQALMPVLLTMLPGQHWPGFLAEAVAASLALWVAWSRVPDLPKLQIRNRPYILGTALWASGIVSVATGLLWLGGGRDNPLRLVFIGVGLALIALFFAWEWRRRVDHPADVRIERRPVTVALFVGVVIAIAQNVAMLELPVYFSVVQGYGPLFGIVAVAPLFLALVAAGPVAGFLLVRFSPRHLVAGGVVAVGLGNLVLAAIIGPRGSSYLGFVVPLLVIGAGFVIATTVRTAIIFASVPRGLPATAAALNEASISVGARAGIVVSTAIVATTAVAALEPSLVGLSPAAAEAQRQTFQGLLTVVGTPALAGLTSAVTPEHLAAYADAYLTGVRWALFLGGVAAVLGGAVAWVLLGRRDPLVTMWEHRDERGDASAGEAPAPGAG